MVERAATAAAQATPHYVAVYVEGHPYLVPQEDVRTLEPAAGVDTDKAAAGAIGTINYKDACLPVYRLSSTLDALRDEHGAQGICAILGDGREHYGLLCAEAMLIEAGDVDIREVPTAMRRADSPVLGLALHNGSVVCVSSAAAILHTIHGLRPLS